ncbi:MAG: hypothetical protein VR74_20085 [Hyphomonas sp. BRH_c22]|nr:MAG: hypothetical protein VR74_20085 [Hyphomonas sp. BRH_c22]
MRRQSVLRECPELVERFLEVGVLDQFDPGRDLITEGAEDTDVYFILMGRFELRVKGNVLGERGVNDMVGELALLRPSNKRSATLTAVDPSVVLKVSKEDFQALAEPSSAFWKNVAEVISDRLDLRNQMLPNANERPIVLVVSSGEAIDVVREIETNLGEDGTIGVEPWNKIFAISTYPLSQLKAAIDRADFVIAIMRGDDVLVSRSKKAKAPRDNVVLEFGMALGSLGLDRSIMLVPTDAQVKLASDNDGLTYVGYKENDSENSLRIACNKIRKHIGDYGVKD